MKNIRFSIYYLIKFKNSFSIYLLIYFIKHKKTSFYFSIKKIIIYKNTYITPTPSLPLEINLYKTVYLLLVNMDCADTVIGVSSNLIGLPMN